jgi:hypothetical protein
MWSDFSTISEDEFHSCKVAFSCDNSHRYYPGRKMNLLKPKRERERERDREEKVGGSVRHYI